MSFPEYAKYKESNCQELGRVPVEWSVLPLKRFARMSYGDALPSDLRATNGNIPVFGSNGIVGAHDAVNTDAPAILVGRKGSYGALNWTDVPAFAIDTVYFIDSHSCTAHLRWLYWLLHIANWRVFSQDTGVPGLSRELAHETRLPFPSPEEQQAIAVFLDRETAKIDALVAEQERLIELLKEKRQAVISHAVTNGLDPNVPMNDSGIEWLGDVPEHWDVMRLKQVGSLQGGAGFPHEYQAQQDEELPFYKVGDLARAADDRTMGQPDNTISQDTASQLRAKIIPPGAIVYAKIGAALLLNRRRITAADCCIDNNMTAFIPDREALSHQWAFYWLGIIDFGEMANPGAVPSFSEGDQAILPIAVPPQAEQDEIVSYLDVTIAKLDALSSEARQAISLLKERRSALISAAVTGKIDVRGQISKSTSSRNLETA